VLCHSPHGIRTLLLNRSQLNMEPWHLLIVGILGPEWSRSLDVTGFFFK
jgi:hypothetical protein